jgi:hypothetical protein
MLHACQGSLLDCDGSATGFIAGSDQDGGVGDSWMVGLTWDGSAGNAGKLIMTGVWVERVAVLEFEERAVGADGRMCVS